MQRPCLRCGQLHDTRIAQCPARPSATRRGYGQDHQRARQFLALNLPAPCGYCGQTIWPGTRWHAAHVIDGHPEHGWMPAHGSCNIAAGNTNRTS
jgi:hypothetical protein